jgi:hypothetical protein
MTWYRKMMCDNTMGKILYELVYVTCKNYKICFIYGAWDFCIGHIKYLKIMFNIFPGCIQRSGTHIAMNT